MSPEGKVPDVSIVHWENHGFRCQFSQQNQSQFCNPFSKNTIANQGPDSGGVYMCVLESGDGISHKVTDELSPIFWGFLKWGYPQIIQDWIILVLKLMGLGNHQCFTTNFYLWTSESRQSRHQSGHLSHGCHFGLKMGGTMGYPLISTF